VRRHCKKFFGFSKTTLFFERTAEVFQGASVVGRKLKRAHKRGFRSPGITGREFGVAQIVDELGRIRVERKCFCE